MSDPSVVLEDVHVTYHIAGGGRRLRGLFARSQVDRSPRQVRAVRGVTFSADEGETVGLIGRNGSGKSSLLRAAAGLLPVTAGSIRAVAPPALLGVGAALKADSTGRQNVLLGASAMGLDRREIFERMDEILDFAGVTEAADQPFGTYSSGMKARLQFAVATATRPRILMIDEALAVGDEEFRERSQQRIRQLLDGASTVFLVSHALLEIERRCDRALWLEKGEQVMWGPAEEVVGAYREDMAARRAAARETSVPDADAAPAPAPARGASTSSSRRSTDADTGTGDRRSTEAASPAPGAWEHSRHAVDERLAALDAETQRLRAHLARAGQTVSDALPGPVFLGGTSVAGVRLLARLLGRHPDVETIPTQLRFHASNGGFRAVLDERESPEQFADRVRTRYFEATGDGPPKGLALLARPRDLSHAERQLLALAPADLIGALRTYMNVLVSPHANGRGATTWVETTPDNVAVADCLLAVFPTGHVVHLVRDGRDVVADVLDQPWGPSTMEDALAWWVDQIRDADRAARVTDQGRLRVVRYEDLVREGAGAQLVPQLLSWLDLPPVDGAENWLGPTAMSSASPVGHHRSTLAPDDASRLERDYAKVYAELAEEGVECLPAPPGEVDELSESGMTTGRGTA